MLTVETPDLQMIRTPIGRMINELQMQIPSILGRAGIAILIMTAVAVGLYLGTPSLSHAGRMTLMIFSIAIVAWTLSPLNDTLVALTAMLATVVVGVTTIEDVHQSLGHELIWLLIAAFAMGSVLRASGIMEHLVRFLLSWFSSFPALCYALAVSISLTAFLIPSTSGRAALLLPVYLELAERLPDRRLVRPLALVFPTAILLSAGGSLIGAGAHFVAIDYIAQTSGTQVDFLSWIVLAFPFAFATTLMATWVILRLFLPDDLRDSHLATSSQPHCSFNPRKIALSLVVLTAVALWITSPWHGIHFTVIAIGAMVITLSGLFSKLKPKEAFKSIEIELIVFLAAIFVLADALTKSGADLWLAKGITNGLLGTVPQGSILVIIALAVISLLAHILITSRTARATVIIPAIVLPLSGLGHDPMLLILVAVLGTGFCQTFKTSAKPVAVFASIEREPFSQADLMRLSTALLPLMAIALVAYSTIVLPPLKSMLPTGAVQTRAISAPLAATPERVETNTQTAAMVCGDEEILLLMKARIYDRDLYASGWWRLWKDLAHQGVHIDRNTVRRLYRGHRLVKLRHRSIERHNVRARSGDIQRALQLCRSQGRNL
jgi:anion transporter